MIFLKRFFLISLMKAMIGNELMIEFRKRKKMIKPAVDQMVEESLGQKSYDSIYEMLDDEEDE